MPRALIPGARYTIVLDGDAEIPKEKQPRFFARVMSGRDWLQFSEDYDAAIEAVKFADQIRHMFDLLRRLLSGWENMQRDGADLPFGETALEDVLDPFEVTELLNKIREAAALKATDRKNSESPPSSSTDTSVATAAPASA